MVKPKLLYHGSDRKLIKLNPRKPHFDLPENSMKAVFATDNKERAISMGLTNQKNSSSFSSRDRIMINFVRGKPKMKYVYLHYFKPGYHWIKNRKGEYVCYEEIKPFKIERYEVSKLDNIWRKSNKKELNEFLKNRDKWKTPKSK